MKRGVHLLKRLILFAIFVSLLNSLISLSFLDYWVHLGSTDNQDQKIVPETLVYMNRILSETQNFRIKPKEQYSSVDCIHDIQQVPRCLFSNVGFFNNHIVFYENPLEPLSYISSDIVTNFPNNYIQIRSGGKEFNQDYIEVVKIQSPIPIDSVYSYTNFSYLMNPFWPQNFGHWLIDDIFASFVNMLEWGVYRDDVEYVIPKGCNVYFDVNSLNNQFCREFYRNRIKGITKQIPWFVNENIYPLESIEHQLNNNLTSTYNENKLIFQNMLMGQSSFSLQSTSIKNAFHWRLFRSIYLENFNIDNFKLFEHQITIIKKTGRRNILNFDELISWTKSFGIALTILDPLKLSWNDQLSIISNTTILITVPGGVSFIAGFLRPQAVSIIFDAWSYQLNSSRGLENYWWTSLTAFKLIRYTFNSSEAVIASIDNLSDEIKFGCNLGAILQEKDKECIASGYTDLLVDEHHFKSVVYDSIIIANQRFGLQ